MEKLITYFGQPAKVGCDEKCNKAWGINNRPRVYVDIGEKVFGLDDESIYPDDDTTDPDNYAYCSDDELPEAPEHPGTWEGNDKKPVNKVGIPNRWCIRECERCCVSEPGDYEKPLQLKDFSIRRKNIAD